VPKNAKGQWTKGTSGNPKGKVHGTKNHLTRKCQALLSENGEAILKVAVTKALGGDVACLKLLLPRIAPSPRTPCVEFTLPPTDTITGLAKAVDSLLAATAAAELAPEQTRDLVGLLDIKRRVIESADLEARILRLEAMLNGAGQ